MKIVLHDVNGIAHERLRLGEHEVLLSFNDDIGAEAFDAWWYREGRYQFYAWAEMDEYFQRACTES